MIPIRARTFYFFSAILLLAGCKPQPPRTVRELNNFKQACKPKGSDAHLLQCVQKKSPPKELFSAPHSSFLDALKKDAPVFKKNSYTRKKEPGFLSFGVFSIPLVEFWRA